MRAVVAYCEYVKSGGKDLSAYDTYAKAMRDALVKMRSTLDQGGKWKKWDGWTKCEHFRLHTPPPTIDQVDRIIKTYRKKVM